MPFGVVPGGVRDGGAVRRESGRQLVGGIVALDQALGDAVGKGHPIEPPGGVEDRHGAVRRHRRPADHPGPEGIPRDVELRPGLLGDPPPDLGHEGDFLGGAARGVHPDDPTAPQQVDGGAVRAPRIPGEDALGLHPLGEVGLDGIGEQALGPGVEIAEEERGAGPEPVPLERDRATRDTPREGEPAPVGGGLRRDRATARSLVLLLGLPLGHVVDLARLEVEFPDLHGAPDHVALGGRREVEVEGPVLRWRRPARPPVFRAVDQFHSAAAIGVEEVEARPPRAGEGVPAGHDPLPAREPGRRGDPRFRVLVDRPRVAAVGVHEPEVRLPAPVGNESDGRAVGRPARVVVDRHPAVLGQAFRLPPGDRHLVDAAQQVEDDGSAVR